MILYSPCSCAVPVCMVISGLFVSFSSPFSENLGSGMQHALHCFLARSLYPGGEAGQVFLDSFKLHFQAPGQLRDTLARIR